MKKCLIVVDLFKHIIENMQSDTTLKNDSSTINKNYFEPRIDNVRVQIDPYPDRNAFNATVVFDIVGQEFPTQEFSFLLEATR